MISFAVGLILIFLLICSLAILIESDLDDGYIAAPAFVILTAVWLLMFETPDVITDEIISSEVEIHKFESVSNLQKAYGIGSSYDDYVYVVVKVVLDSGLTEYRRFNNYQITDSDVPFVQVNTLCFNVEETTHVGGFSLGDTINHKTCSTTRIIFMPDTWDVIPLGAVILEE